MVDPSDGVRAAESIRVCRSEIQHEYSLLSNRLSSYILSQSFLATGYAISMANVLPNWGFAFRIAIAATFCLLGILLSVRAMPGISGASRVIVLWHERQITLLSGCPLEDYAVMSTDEYRQIQKRSSTFSMAAVWAFGAGWVVFLAVVVWMGLSAPAY